MTRCDLSAPDARCPVCGFQARRRDGRLVVGAIRSCPGPRPLIRLPRPLVGDWIEAAARLVRITPERVERWTRRPCGCKARQRWLNDRAAAVAERLERWLLDPLSRGR